MELNSLYHGFKLLKKAETKTSRATVHEFIHEKSGARLFFLDREDENKTFSIGFNTPPEDNTGVFHILEHSTLCGSRKFPVKEPFVELLKSSLYTFLNAMTYPDRTIYPVSSMNDKDFLNLIDVYMDAVLHPTALTDERVFRQEGWHYEPVTSEDGSVTALSYNGVVFNEMKGAYSDPDNVNYMAMMRALFPDTAYSKDSGGTPEGIPTLTFEGFKRAHERFYHPSGSCIVLDGSVDLSSVLPLLDSYLKDYDRAAPTECVKLQKPTGEVRERVTVEATEGEDLTDKGKILVAFRSPDSTDREASLAMSLIADVLTGTNDAPLKKPLINSGLCGDVGFFTESSNLEDVFIIELRDVKDGAEDKLLSLLYETLENIAQRGISGSKLKSTLSYTEFKHKESDMGYSPLGLVYATVIYSTVFYDRDPISALDLTDLFDSLRERIGTDYFQKLLKRFIIDNSERAIIVSTPDVLAGEKSAENEKAALGKAFEELKAKERGLEEVVEAYLDFNEWQARENSEEALATIPKLELSDLTPPPRIPTKAYDALGVKVISHPLDTSGIIYSNLFFDVSDLTGEELSLLSFFSSVMTELPTEKYSKEKLAERIRLYLGGFYSTVSYTRTADPSPYIKVSVSSLERNRRMLAELTEEILINGKYTYKKSLKRLLSQHVSRHREMISTEGMAAATLAASAPFTESAVISDSTVGIGAYKNMKAILDTFDTDADKLVEDITALAKRVFAKSRLTLSVTGKHDKKFILRLISIFPEGDAPIKRKIALPDRIDRGIVLPSRVSYAVCAGHLATADKGARDTVRMNGGLAVARSIIRLIYLWDEVRVKGGAYGSGLTMDRFGNFAFTSYRDPSPKKSLETYRKAPDFLRAFVKDKRDLKEHVIGTAGKMYIPSSPRQTGEGATADFMSGITHEYKQALFDSILSATYADILEAADLLEKALKTTAKAIAGGKQDLDACADVLDSITEF